MDKVFKELKKYNNNKFNPKLFEYDDFLSLKFNLSKKLKIDCFRNNDFDVIKIKNNKISLNKNIILTNIKKCKILPLYIFNKDSLHLISFIIDNNEKTISLFTNSENKTFYKKIMKLFDEKFELNYEINIDDEKIKCDSYKVYCVPLSLLMIYSYFKNVKMNEFIEYINNISIESAYNLIDYFLNYLEN